MRFRTKLVIALAAVLISLLSFQIIATATSADKMITIGHKAGTEIIANYLAKAEAARQSRS